MITDATHIFKLRITSRPIEVIEVNDTVSLDCNAVMIQNAGNDTAMLNGEWTMRPGGVVAIGSQTDINEFVDTISIKFTGIGDNPRIEIWPLQTTICQCIPKCELM